MTDMMSTGQWYDWQALMVPTQGRGAMAMKEMLLNKIVRLQETAYKMLEHHGATSNPAWAHIVLATLQLEATLLHQPPPEATTEPPHHPKKNK